MNTKEQIRDTSESSISQSEYKKVSDVRVV